MRVLGVVFIVVALGANVQGSGKKGPEIKVVDNKLSIYAEAVPLGRLLGLLDRATGMKSKVPRELADRNVSVQFSGLRLEEAIKKIFEGLPLDYVVVEARGIFVTAVSQSLSAAQSNPGAPVSPAPVFVTPGQTFVDETPPPFNPDPIPAAPQFQPAIGNPFTPAPQTGAGTGLGVSSPGEQPAVIQTPFGPIPNPRANPNQQQPPNNMPFAVPGQGTTFPYGTAPPFGANNPFNNNSPGSTSPSLFNTNPNPFPGTPTSPPPNKKP